MPGNAYGDLIFSAGVYTDNGGVNPILLATSGVTIDIIPDKKISVESPKEIPTTTEKPKDTNKIGFKL